MQPVRRLGPSLATQAGLRDRLPSVGRERLRGADVRDGDQAAAIRLVAAIGVDAARYALARYSLDSPIDLDLDLRDLDLQLRMQVDDAVDARERSLDLRGLLPQAGEIGAVAKLAVTATGDTISSRENPLTLPHLDFPQPTLMVAIEPQTKAGRIGLPGLEKGREEVIASGAIIIRTIMETLGEKECLVSDLGLREGVLIDLAKRIG